MSRLFLVALLALLPLATGFTAVARPPLRPPTVTSLAVTQPAAALPATSAAAATSVARARAPAMGLFGLGAPELAIIGAVALFVLGPENFKSMAKDFGKISAELKQVPEEFNKGMEIGQTELAQKKLDGPADAEPPAPPPTPPPAA